VTAPTKARAATRSAGDELFEATVRALTHFVWNLVKGAPPYPWPMPHRRSLPRGVAQTVGGLSLLWLAHLRVTDPAAAAAFQPRLTAAAYAAGAVALGALGWSWAERALTRRFRRDWLDPAWDVACRHLGYETRWDARHYMHLTPLRASDPHGVRVHVPKDFDDAKKRVAFVAAFKEVLQIKDAVVHWDFSSRYSFVQFTDPARMPEEVFFSDPHVRALVESAKEHKPLLGLGRRKPVRIDFNAESPHMLVSMSTGGGKSELFKSLLAHFMHHGAWVVVLDMKRQSQQWLRGLAGVDYWRDLLQMHRSLIAVAQEGDRRNRVADNHEGTGGPAFRRIIVAIEELNATINKLQQFWDVNRTNVDIFPGLTDAERRQRKSPAVLALNDILYMGRAVRINVMACGQLATAHALGGPAVRECFTARILGRATKKAWAMLADLIANPPKVFRTTAGRFHLVVGPNCDEVQGLYFTDDEAKDYALAGSNRPTYEDVFTPLAVPALADDDPRRTPLADALAADRQPRPNLTVVPSPDDLAARAITMAEASSDEGRGVIPMKAAAIRKAKSRDPEFPTPVVITDDGRALWLPEQFTDWVANRPRPMKEAAPTPAEPEPGDAAAMDAIFGRVETDEDGDGIPDDEYSDEPADDEVMV
jgi:hypothetical protein